MVWSDRLVDQRCRSREVPLVFGMGYYITTAP